MGENTTVIVDGNSTLAPCLKEIPIHLLIISEPRFDKLMQSNDLGPWIAELRSEISPACAILYERSG